MARYLVKHRGKFTFNYIPVSYLSYWISVVMKIVVTYVCIILTSFTQKP